MALKPEIAGDKIYICKISDTVLFKLYQIQNSEKYQIPSVVL